MELNQLKTFSAVVKNQHFTRAAEELHLSQPAVSRQIKSLENKFGGKLFIRNNSGIELTKLGQIVYKHTETILDLEFELLKKLEDDETSLENKLVIGCVTRGLGNNFLDFYEKFTTENKNIDLRLQTEYKLEDLVEKVNTEEIDIGVVSHKLDLSNLKVSPFGEYKVLCVVGKNHRLADKKKITVSELKYERWAMFESTNRLTISTKDVLEEYGITTKNIYETNDGALIKAIVSNGKRVSFLPEWGVTEEIKDNKLIPLEIENFEFSIQTDLIYKPSNKPELVNIFVSFCEDLVKQINSKRLIINEY